MSREAAELLSCAQVILKQRGEQYGDAERLFRNFAVRFGLVLGQPVTPYMAARLLAELKSARLDEADEFNEDSILDLINYAALAGVLHHGKKEEKS